MEDKRRLRVSFNAPATLIFAALCALATLLGFLTGGASTDALFSVYRASLLSPLTWLRFFGHVFGHLDWSHLMANLMFLLILGPMLEEKYGARGIVLLIGAVALVTGLVNFVFFPYSQMLGASGVVFAMMLLASITGPNEGGIPLTFLLVAALYIGQQLYQAFRIGGNISYTAHIIGGMIGAALGFAMNRWKAIH